MEQEIEPQFTINVTVSFLSIIEVWQRAMFGGTSHFQVVVALS